MIGKVMFGKITPCFMANKQVNGDLSRVKKDTAANGSQCGSNINKDGVDTFTSSVDEIKKDKNVEENDKNNSTENTQQGN